jgi:DNA-3-methyladenine glycosylase I
VLNCLKVAASVTNAKAFLEVQKEFGSFDKYIWGFIGGKTLKNKWKSMVQVPATTKEFDAMSKDLKNVDSNLLAQPSAAPSCRQQAW